MINIAVEYVECSVVVADINVAVCPDVACLCWEYFAADACWLSVFICC